MQYISREEIETKLYNLYPKEDGLPIKGGAIQFFSYAELITIIEEDMENVDIEIPDKEFHERKPVLVEYHKTEAGKEFASCPMCDGTIGEKEIIYKNSDYCPYCGQPIRWE